MKIRFAVPEDAEAINAIYQQAIDSPTPQAPHVSPMTLEERRAWLAQRPANHPVFVYDAGPEGILGFSSLSPPIFRPRPKLRRRLAAPTAARSASAPKKSTS